MFTRFSFAVSPFLSRLSGWMAAALIVTGSTGQGLAVEATESYPVTLAWDANPETDVIGYRLYYGAAQGNYSNAFDAGNNTSATIPFTGPGPHYVTAVAYNTAGLESLPSTELEIAAPAPPDGGSTTETDVSVTMAWDANPEPDVIGYRLYYGTVSGTYPNILDAGSSTTLTIAPIAPGTYYMIVTAYNTAGLESLPSAELQVVVDSAADTQSPVIADLPGEIVTVPDSPGGTSAVVSWSPPQATDNVGIASLTSTHQSGDRFPAGTTTVVYTARDAAGNQATASFTVTIGGVSLWQQQAFGTSASDPLVAGDQVNADGDRWGNLGEYALGLQASVSDGENAFAQTLEGDQAVLHLFHNPYLPDVVLQVERSENLATGWYAVATRQPGREWTASLPGLEIATGRTGNLQEVTLRDAVANKPTAFYRLTIQRPEIQ